MSFNDPDDYLYDLRVQGWRARVEIVTLKGRTNELTLHTGCGERSCWHPRLRDEDGNPLPFSWQQAVAIEQYAKLLAHRSMLEALSRVEAAQSSVFLAAYNEVDKGDLDPANLAYLKAEKYPEWVSPAPL